MLALFAMGAAMAIFGQQYQTLMTLFRSGCSWLAQWSGPADGVTGWVRFTGAMMAAGFARIGRPGLLLVIFGVVVFGGADWFGLAPSFVVALAHVDVGRFCGAAFMGLNSTLIMSNAPPHLYGRI